MTLLAYIPEWTYYRLPLKHCCYFHFKPEIITAIGAIHFNYRLAHSSPSSSFASLSIGPPLMGNFGIDCHKFGSSMTTQCANSLAVPRWTVVYVDEFFPNNFGVCQRPTFLYAIFIVAVVEIVPTASAVFLFLLFIHSLLLSFGPGLIDPAPNKISNLQ